MKNNILLLLLMTGVLFVNSCMDYSHLEYEQEVLTAEEFLTHYEMPEIIFQYAEEKIIDGENIRVGFLIDNTGDLRKYTTRNQGVINQYQSRMTISSVQELHKVSESTGMQVDIEMLVENYKGLHSLNAEQLVAKEDASEYGYYVGYGLISATGETNAYESGCGTGAATGRSSAYSLNFLKSADTFNKTNRAKSIVTWMAEMKEMAMKS